MAFFHHDNYLMGKLLAEHGREFALCHRKADGARIRNKGFKAKSPPVAVSDEMLAKEERKWMREVRALTGLVACNAED